MRKLYYNVLSPACRKVRIALGEKGLRCDLISENLICTRKEFLKMSPTGEIPLLVDESGVAVPDHTVICEYLEDVYPISSLWGKEVKVRLESRRLTRFFDEKFAREVTFPLLMEKVIKMMKNADAPDSHIIRQSKAILKEHLAYIEWLVVRRNWLAGENLSYADIAAAAHLSIVDYLGDVPWDKFPDAKEWYTRIKSRPSFAGILKDKIVGVNPPCYYNLLDF